MADVRLTVSPDELKRAAVQVEAQIAAAERDWARLYETARASRHYWEGEAADYRHRLLEEAKQEVQEALRRLKAHPPHLLEMAGIYIDAEEKAASLVNSLPDDAIL